MPHALAGSRRDPPVSVPVASGTNRAASSAALPPDEPPARTRCSTGCPPVRSRRRSRTRRCGRGPQHHARVPQLPPHRRVTRRDVAVEHPARRGQGQSGDGEQVLEGQRDSADQGRVAVGAAALRGQSLRRGIRGLEGHFGIDPDPAADFPVEGGASGQAGVEQFPGVQAAGTEQARGLDRAEQRRIGDRDGIGRRQGVRGGCGVTDCRSGRSGAGGPQRRGSGGAERGRAQEPSS